MNSVTTKLADALRRIADPRNTHFAGDAQVVAREALAAYEQAQPVQDLPPLTSQFEALLGIYWQAGYDEGTGHPPEVDPNETLSRIRQEVRDYARAAMAATPAPAPAKPPKHRFWGVGEAECPADIKASNGELHSLRCKVCGATNPRDQFCWQATTTAQQAEPTDEQIKARFESRWGGHGWQAVGAYYTVGFRDGAALAATPAPAEPEDRKSDVKGALAIAMAYATGEAPAWAATPAPEGPVGEVRTMTGTPDFPHAPFNTVMWTGGMQPPPGTKLYTAPVAATPAPAPQPLTDEQIEGGRSKLFSVGNPYCPITEKAMRTAVRWAERAHGIGQLAATPAPAPTSLRARIEHLVSSYYASPVLVDELCRVMTDLAKSNDTADAERYRWLKKQGHAGGGDFYFRATGQVPHDKLDEAIDAARLKNL